MYERFIKAFNWNATGAFFYKTILLLHQIAMFSIVSPTMYGLIGTLFAVIYLFIAITNFGFEYTLLPFFATFTKSKSQFSQMLHHLIVRILMVAILALCFYAMLITPPFVWIDKISSQCPTTLLMIMSSIFFVESIKKTVNTIMQLAFMNKEIAIAELTMLISYIVTVWSRYLIYKTVTLYDIFIPLLITSIFELSYFLILLSRLYRSLPVKKETPIKIPFYDIASQRFYNYINQLAKTFFSPNCMIIILSSSFGLHQVGTIKLFTNAIALIYTFLNRTIGITSGATFSLFKKESISKNEIKETFEQITQKYFKALVYIASSFVCYMIYIILIKELKSDSIMWQVIPFFMISFLDYLVVTYEQLFMAQKQAFKLAVINISNIAITSCLLMFFYLSLHKILLILLAIRILSIAFISFIANKIWGIKPLFNFSRHKNY